jgi:hypothetical protein
MNAYITSYLRYQNLDERAIRAISGALINRLNIDQPIPFDKFADIVYDHDIPTGKPPENKIIKMSRKEHVDRFFDYGELQIGNFNYFNNFEHGEIGDKSEGIFVLVGRHNNEFAFAEIAGGFHYYAFCSYSGDPDQKCLNLFGYDTYFTINDVEGFSLAISNTLKSQYRQYSSCVYSKDKVVVGDVKPDFDFNVISAGLLELASSAKFFVKPLRYSHQREFRFIWSSDSDLSQPIIVKCPEAIKYCTKH